MDAPRMASSPSPIRDTETELTPTGPAKPARYTYVICFSTFHNTSNLNLIVAPPRHTKVPEDINTANPPQRARSRSVPLYCADYKLC